MIKMFSMLFIMLSMSLSNTHIDESLELNKENLMSVLVKLDIQHPDLVFGQAILESASLKSKLVRTHNNLFGMKVPNRRKTVATNLSGYAKYTNWVQSVIDYKLYQDYVTKNQKFSRSKYISILAKNYSETSDYINRVYRVIKENKAYII